LRDPQGPAELDKQSIYCTDGRSATLTSAAIRCLFMRHIRLGREEAFLHRRGRFGVSPPTIFA
jgi:hypothetical protein